MSKNSQTKKMFYYSSCFLKKVSKLSGFMLKTRKNMSICYNLVFPSGIYSDIFLVLSINSLHLKNCSLIFCKCAFETVYCKKSNINKLDLIWHVSRTSCKCSQPPETNQVWKHPEMFSGYVICIFGEMGMREMAWTVFLEHC